MFSGPFYENRPPVRERNMNLLLETVTYIAIKERFICNYNRHSHVHNALQKIPHNRSRNVTCIIVNILVTESTTSKPAKVQQTLSLA